jgi:hypothetical protein
MDRRPSLVDRLRIERALWTLDTLLQDLPGRRRKAIRRELRADLWASAVETGGAEAIRQLGSLRRLAIEYLDAEYGGGKRPRWVTGLAWGVGMEILFSTAIIARTTGFMDGLEAGRPGDGTYSVRPLGGWGPIFEVTYVDGGQFGGFLLDLAPALVPWFLVVSVAFLVGARSWRALPAWRRRTGGRLSRQRLDSSL